MSVWDVRSSKKLAQLATAQGGYASSNGAARVVKFGPKGDVLAFTEVSAWEEVGHGLERRKTYTRDCHALLFRSFAAPQFLPCERSIRFEYF